MPPPRRPDSRIKSANWLGRLAAWIGIALLACLDVRAASAMKKPFNIPAGEALSTLKQFSEQSGEELLYSVDAIEGVKTSAVKGHFLAGEALGRMLNDTPLRAVPNGKSGGFSVARAQVRKDSAGPNGPRAAQKAEGDRSSESPKKKGIQTPQTQQPMKRNRLLAKLAAAFALFTAPAVNAAEGTAPAVDATQSTGIIQGRVQNQTTGDYLSNAHVSVDGSILSALTNEFGEYRLAEVPAGEVRLTVFYSGLPSENVAVSVAPGRVAVKDVEMKSTVAGGGVIQMEAFTVKAEQLSESALAVNEQRFAPNIKTVIEAESFGHQTDGNLADFLKYVPGLAVNYLAQDANSATVRGMPSHTTIVSFNGNEMASSPTGATRAFEFEKVTINDAAQVEFNKTLLPDMPAEGIGGTINIVTKSAFQRSRPLFTYKTYFNFNTNLLELRKTPGIEREPTYKIKPGFDFTYIKPVNRDFGITISGSMLSKYNPQNLSLTQWTLSPDAAGVENPSLQNFTLQDTPKFTDRYSGRIGADWRFGGRNVLTVGFSQQYYDSSWMGRRWVGSTGTNPSAFDRDFTQGRPAAGSVVFSGNAAHKYGTTWTPEFKYVYTGAEWKTEVRGARSASTAHMRAVDNNHFQNMNFSLGSFNAAGARVAPTVRMYNFGNYIPDVTAVNGGVITDAHDVNEFVLNSATDLNREIKDLKKSLFAHTQRRVGVAGVSVRVKLGGDIREKIRDMRSWDPAYTFVGADGRAGTADDAVSALGMDIVDPYSEISPPFGLAKFKWPSQYKLYDLYRAHPNWWTRNPAAEHQQQVSNSRYLKETISSGFLRLDAQMFENRLAFVGGVRFQGYRSHAEAGVVDNLGQYVQDESGNLVIDPVTGRFIRLTGSAIELNERTNIERGNITKGKTDEFFPSLNVLYRLRDNLQVRLGYADSVSYPNLTDLAAVTTVSDVTANPPRLTANSPLRPWFGKNYDLDIEYYTKDGGSYTLAFFRKEITDFVNQIRHNAGTPAAAAALERYGYAALVPLNYEVVERFNDGEAAFDGWEFAMQQKLDGYLPGWARGLTVFFNLSYTAAPSGVSSGNIGAASQQLINWGARYGRGRLSASVRWNHKPEPKRQTPNPTHTISYTLMDFDLSYQFRPAASFFLSLANLTSAPLGSQYVYTSNTPDYARRRSYDVYGIQGIIGLKGQF